jgi:cation diffusion facilitator family transporter
MAHSSGDPTKAVKAALFANGGIAIAKFFAAFYSGSATMLAEGVHSVADTCNQALLLVGIGLSKRRDPKRFPLGRAKETYFWGFVVSLMLFFLGGVYAIYEGVHKLMSGGEPGSPIVPVVVLSISILLEGGSFAVAVREFNKQRGDTPVRQALFSGKDPIIPIVVLEDAGAMFGLVVALVAVVVASMTGSSLPDALGSIVIGVLLCVIGVVLARDTRSLLIGEGMTPEMSAETLRIASQAEGVEEVTQMLSMHLGPQTILLALKVRFTPGMSVAESERVVDGLEASIRSKIPQMSRIFVEADGDYDPERDPVKQEAKLLGPQE